MAYEIKRSTYAEIYGPTTGDRMRLGDTSRTDYSAGKQILTLITTTSRA